MKDLIVDVATVSLIFVIGFMSALTFGTVVAAGYMNTNLGVLTYLVYDFLFTAALIGFITLAYSYSTKK